MFNLARPLTRLIAALSHFFQAKDDTAADFTDYLGENGIDFTSQDIEKKEHTLHDYLTQEIGLNLFSDIEDEYTIRMTYGDQQQKEYLDIDLRKPMQPQIELLVACFEQYCSDNGNHFDAQPE